MMGNEQQVVKAALCSSHLMRSMSAKHIRNISCRGKQELVPRSRDFYTPISSLPDSFFSSLIPGTVFNRPEMYMGEIQPSDMDAWVMDDDVKLMKKKSVRYSPALNKVRLHSTI